VSRSVFSGNTGRNGGAILSVGDPLIVADSSFNGNKAEGIGGAIAETDDGFLEVSDSVFNANAANLGGAIYAGGGPATTFADSRFKANTSATFGGAIATTTYMLLASDVLSGNEAGERSGAVEASNGRLDLIATRVVGNSAATAPGGVFADVLNLSKGSVVSGNHPGNCVPAAAC
jgi:predicted outer membrane repeat protein